MRKYCESASKVSASDIFSTVISELQLKSDVPLYPSRKKAPAPLRLLKVSKVSTADVT